MHIPDHWTAQRLSRRQVVALGVGAFAVAVWPFSRRSQRQLIRRSLPLMGTIAEIAVLHDDPREAHAAIDAAFEQLTWVDQRMTRFSPTSDIGRANLEAATGPVRVAPETAAVLAEALHWAEASEGVFDPCIGKATALWDIPHRHRPPATAALRPLAGRYLYKRLDVDRWRGDRVVGFRDPDVSIDLGGIAKGYGVDRAAEALRRRRIGDALVNVGGDLYALGTSADGDPWTVGIRSPADPTQLAGTLEVSDAAVATSGDYLQFFEYHGLRYHHLLDPTTGAPKATPMHSITVMADTCMAADAAATTLFGMTPAKADRVLLAAARNTRVVRSI